MGRQRKRKVRLCISIDPELVERMRDLAEAEQEGVARNDMSGPGVSGIVEECLRRSLTVVRRERAPELVERLESLEFARDDAKREMARMISKGEFSECLKHEVLELEMEIQKELQEREVARLIEDSRQKEPQ